jgi:membrane associated rhomboid family serine protease
MPVTDNLDEPEELDEPDLDEPDPDELVVESPLRRWLTSNRVILGLMIVQLLAFAIESASGGIGGRLDFRLALIPQLIAAQPWTPLTTLFTNVSPVGLLAALFSLYSAGPLVERVMGHRRFLVIYLLSGLGGSDLTVVTGTGPTAGPGAATLGMLGALAVIYLRAGASAGRILSLIGYNVVINVVIFSLTGGAGWVGVVGGLVSGAIVGLIYFRRKPDPSIGRRDAIAAAFAAVLVIALVIAVIARPVPAIQELSTALSTVGIITPL